MSFHRWLRNLCTTRATGHSQGRRGNSLRATPDRPFLEVLEDRLQPSFSPVMSFPVDINLAAVVTADFNNDGKVDLATSQYDGTTGTVSVFLGKGDGSFHSARTFATGPYPFSLTASDFNGDGKIDLATGNYDYDDVNDVSILLGRGDGSFSAPVALNLSGGYTWSITSGDLNADGKSDLVVTSDDEFFGGYVSVLLGRGDGSFATSTTYGPYYGGQIFSPTLADFNRDGKVDVAVASWRTNSVKVFLGNGDGTLREPIDFTTASGPDSVVAGDFNADGKSDLAATCNNGFVSLLLGNGDGTFQPARFYESGYAHTPNASDVNGDGVLDLVVANPTYTTPNGGAVSVLLGNGNGSLASPIATATGGNSTISVVMADFNGDGRPDAAAVNSGSNTVSVMINDGNWGSSVLPSLSISDAIVTEGNSGTVNATFTVTLSSAASADVTVTYSTANLTASAGSDYQAVSGTLTIPAGHTTGTITVLVNGDRLGELNETFTVNLSNPTNATIADSQGVGTIRDDEPRISISDVTKREGRKNTTQFTFTVTLSVAYDQPVTFSYRTVDGTATAGSGDYIAKTGTITFAAGETSKTITIVVKGDSKKESDESFYVDLFGNSSNSLFSKSRGIGTILNDD